jgi:hypothetical protein
VKDNFFNTIFKTLNWTKLKKSVAKRISVKDGGENLKFLQRQYFKKFKLPYFLIKNTTFSEHFFEMLLKNKINVAKHKNLTWHPNSRWISKRFYSLNV